MDFILFLFRQKGRCSGKNSSICIQKKTSFEANELKIANIDSGL